MPLKKILAAALLFVVQSRGLAQCQLDYSNYQLILDENFDNLNSVSDLSTRWAFTWPDPNDGKGIEIYDASQVSLQLYDPAFPNKGKIIQLRGEPIPPTSVILNGKTRNISYKSGMLRNIMNYDPGTWSTGFAYGIFEMRAKLPAGNPAIQDDWPTFWFAFGNTEIDMLDNSEMNQGAMVQNGVIDWTKWPGSNHQWTMVNNCNSNPNDPRCNSPYWTCDVDYAAGSYVKYKDNNFVYYATTSIPRSCVGLASYVTAPNAHAGNLSNGYNLYTLVWTPAAVSFFLNGRLQYTVDPSAVATYSDPLQLIVANQVSWQATTQILDMDVDYVRIWKPKVAGNYTPYYSANETQHHDIFGDLNYSQATYTNPPFSNVATTANSITINPNNGDEIFFKDLIGNIYTANKVNQTWNITQLQIPQGYGFTAADGDIKYLPVYDAIVYVDHSNRIGFFLRDYTQPGGWRYSFLTLLNSGIPILASKDVGSLNTAENGDIFFKATNGLMHRCVLSNGQWIDITFPSANNGSDLVKGDVMVEKNTMTVYYKGQDNLLQYFWHDANFNYYHNWVDNQNPVLVKDAPASIELSPSRGLFFIGTDNKIHNYRWNAPSGTFVHSMIPYIYGSHSPDDYVRGGLAWDESKNRLYYGGNDGRIQKMELSGTSWVHDWVNSYWDTHEYDTYDSTTNNTFSPSLTLGSDGPERSIFYAGNYWLKGTETVIPMPSGYNHVMQFKYEPCSAYLNPRHGTLFPNSYRKAPGDSSTTNIFIINQSFEIFPNPTRDIVSLKAKTNVSGQGQFSVYDISGQLLKKGKITENDTRIDVSSFKTGIYNVVVEEQFQIWHLKLTKI